MDGRCRLLFGFGPICVFRDSFCGPGLIADRWGFFFALHPRERFVFCVLRFGGELFADGHHLTCAAENYSLP